MPCRRRFLTAAGAGLVCPLSVASPRSIAQVVSRPARMLVGFAPGSAPDAVARLLVDQMKGYAPAVMVDNRAGAGGRIALEALKRSEADGSVMALTPLDQLALFPHIYDRLAYKPVEDFAPVTPVCSLEFLLAMGPHVSAQVKSLADFIAWCRANPALATYGTPGAGTHPHFLGSTLAHAAKFEFVHAPYKGGPPIVQDLLGSHLAATISTAGLLLPHVKSGALRALATTAPRRGSALPDVPTFRELDYPMLESLERFAVFLPRPATADLVTKLNAAIREALRTEAVKAGFAALSLEPTEASPAALVDLIKTETERWAQVVREAGFKPID
jgi:tripartite-type tricarboxylate transporter receptor subunit TctC